MAAFFLLSLTPVQRQININLKVGCVSVKTDYAISNTLCSILITVRRVMEQYKDMAALKNHFLLHFSSISLLKCFKKLFKEVYQISDGDIP